ncbi:hypothetical protein ACFYNX_05160 [Streptomyces sp. NPDC007872]|uniref:hypothetical protein n=1 Tax=Streptomyces sp. NPDC007872 TaxID=3364782 RepID=UPI0036B01F3B
MIHVKHTVRSAASAVLLLVLAGCGSGGEEAGGALSVDRVVEVADGADADGSDTCPLPYDAGAAAKAAKLDGDLRPGAAGAEADEPAATAEGGRTTDAQSPWAGKPGALITCSYHLGGEDLKVRTGAVSEGNAVYLQAPVIQAAGGMDFSTLKAYTVKGAEAKAGEAVQSGGGNVVTVRLDSGGKGDLALVLTAGDAGKTSLERGQVLALARAFASQAK